MAGTAQLEKTSTQDIAAEAAKRMQPIVSAVSTSRTPTEIIAKLKSIECKNIIQEPPGFLKEPETINFKKENRSYQIDLSEKKTTVTELGTGQTRVVPLKTNEPATKEVSFDQVEEKQPVNIVLPKTNKPLTKGVSVSFDQVEEKQPVNIVLPKTNKPLTKGVSVSSDQFETKINRIEKAVSEALPYAKVIKTETGVNVTQEVNGGFVNFNISLNGEINNAKNVSSDGAESINVSELQSILNKNGYKIDLDEFQKWLQQQLDKMKSGSSGGAGGSTPIESIAQKDLADRNFRDTYKTVSDENERAKNIGDKS